MRLASAIGSVLVVLFVTSACRDDVTAVLGTDLPFSVYGVLSPETDTQWVRVFPIEDRLIPSQPERLDAVVRSLDVQAGAERTWHDTLFVGPEGLYGYFFWAPFAAEYGHTYRLSVTRSDGATVRAEATVPPRSELVIVQNPQAYPTSQFALVRGGAAHFLNVQVRYHVQYGFGVGVDTVFVVRYDRQEEAVGADTQFRIDLANDHRHIEEALRRARRWDPFFGVVLLGLRIRLIVADPQWAPPGDAIDFDPNLLGEPGVLTNVENGFGFVGAGYSLSRSWIPENAMLLRAGFKIHNDTTGTTNS